MQIVLGSPRSPTECFPLLRSPGALAGQWVLESNAGPTGGVIAELAPLTELSGEQLEAALVSRRFVIERRTSTPLSLCSLGTRASAPWVGRTRWPPLSLACGARTLAKMSTTQPWRVVAMP